MKIILLIVLLESLVIASWLILRRIRSQFANTPAAGALLPIFDNAVIASTLPEASRWTFINGWNVEAQADDRRLTLGTVNPQAGSAPARRSFARRSHQRNFKTWSQERHD